MFQVKAIIDTDVLKAIREAGKAAPGKLSVYVHQVARPRLQREVEQRLGRDPGPVVHPFEFATAKSRRWYFAVHRGRLPYRRTGKIRRGFMVKIDLRQSDGLIRIFNKEKGAVYVYGPGFLVTNSRQVPGHKRTGWGKNFDRDILAISELAQDLLIEGWYSVLTGGNNGSVYTG